MEEKIKSLLEEISKNEAIKGRVYATTGIFFVIVNGEILTMSDDAGYSPRGGWFPEIVTCPTEEEQQYITKKMDELDFDEEFFDEALAETGDPDDVDYFFEEYEDDEDEEDEEMDEEDEKRAKSVRIYKALKQEIEGGKAPFETMGEMVSAISRMTLDNELYYWWEGEYIGLYDNVCDCGQEPGCFDSLSPEDWVEVLSNLDDYVVTR